MKLKAYYHWYRLRKATAPDSHFKRALWNKLKKAHQEIYPVTVKKPLAVWRYAMAVLVGVVTVGGLGTASFAYTSPAVTTGTPLYPLKQKIEAVEEKLQRTPEQKVAFDLKKIKRREAEVALLEAKQQKTDRVESEIVKIEEKLATHVQLLTKENRANLRLRRSVEQRLNRAAARVSAPALSKEKGQSKRRLEKIENAFDAVEVTSGTRRNFASTTLVGAPSNTTATLFASNTLLLDSPRPLLQRLRNKIKILRHPSVEKNDKKN